MVFGVLAVFMIVNTMWIFAQEENQQEGFAGNLIDFANKIGIPLKAEEVYDPLIFFQSYGFTLILALIVVLFVLNIAPEFVKSSSQIMFKSGEKLMNLGSQVISKTSEQFKSLEEGFASIKTQKKKRERKVVHVKRFAKHPKPKIIAEAPKPIKEIHLKKTFGVFHPFRFLTKREKTLGKTDGKDIVKALKRKYWHWPETDSNEDIITRGKITVEIGKFLASTKGRFKINDITSIIEDSYRLDRKTSKQLEFEVKTNIIESQEFESFNEDGTILFKAKK